MAASSSHRNCDEVHCLEALMSCQVNGMHGTSTKPTNRHLFFSENQGNSSESVNPPMVLVASDNEEKNTNMGDDSGDLNESEVKIQYVEEPQIGMTFDNLESAFKSYNDYAKGIGFGVRKHRSRKSRVSPYTVLAATLVCSCEGTYTKVKTPTKTRPDKRFNCEAMVEFKLVQDSDQYEVSKFISSHSHEFVPSHSAYMIRSQRKIEPSQVGLISKMHSSGLKQKQIFSYFSEEAGGDQHLNFKRSDCNNLLQRTRAAVFKRGDAQSLQEYFKERKRENKYFFYSFRTNDNFEISGVFFCDAKSRRDYELFGDAICFDTTFKTNNYDMVCAPIVGVNNHGQTTLFGCGLLDGENTNAVVWLFITFLEAMGGKKPISIFTDQAPALAKAISIIFPNSYHGLCLWHIYQNAVKNLSTVFHKFKSFAIKLKSCIYDPETVEEFEQSWHEMLETYGLIENDWLLGLYQLRNKWAQVYSHSHFCAGMTTTQRSESINKFLKSYFGTNIVLREFVNQYAKAMVDRRRKEREEEYKTNHTSPIFISGWSLEREAAKKYTRKLFICFQEEYQRIIDHRLHLESDNGIVRTYLIKELEGRKKDRILTYDCCEHSVSYSCRKFEFQGILCSHALKLFRDLDYACLPSKYYLKRWTRAMTDEVVLDSYGDAIGSDIDPTSTARYSVLSHIAQRIVSKGSKSKELCSLAESSMLEAEAKIDAWISTNEENTFLTQQNISTDLNEDAPIRDPPMKRRKGQPKKRIKGALERNITKKTSNQARVMYLFL